MHASAFFCHKLCSDILKKTALGPDPDQWKNAHIDPHQFGTPMRKRKYLYATQALSKIQIQIEITCPKMCYILLCIQTFLYIYTRCSEIPQQQLKLCHRLLVKAAKRLYCANMLGDKHRPNLALSTCEVVFVHLLADCCLFTYPSHIEQHFNLGLGFANS